MIEVGFHGLETETIERINTLAEERRRLLGRPRRGPEGLGLRARLEQIDAELDRLWRTRREELHALED